jgi:hypothetical protein
MSLLTPLTKINAALADDAKACANHLANSAILANRMVSAMLALDDERLTEWLNSRTPQETEEIFTAHKLLGDAINGAAQVASAVLAASGIAANIPTVDTRSVAEKLAANRRELAFVDGLFTVSTLPPPEPVEEDELEPEPEA